MLYELLSPYQGAMNLFSFITFRVALALATGLILTMLFGAPMIAWLRARQGKGQPIRADGPESHQSKKGTPTMGGFLILFGLLSGTLFWGDLKNQYIWIVLFVTIGFCGVGFIDDYQKVTKKGTAGLSGKVRLLMEFVIAGVAVFWVSHYAQETTAAALASGALAAAPQPGFATGLALPFLKDFMFDLTIYGFIAFGAFVIVGAGNAVNFTDGLDGLAIGPVMIAGATFGFIAYATGTPRFADYLLLTPTPGTAELAVVMGALVGGGLGFLWYNAPPAKVFMGDTGSLALGGCLGAMAVCVKHEMVLAIVGGLFLFEALSVIIQVLYFKATGKRFFKMAPIHHHFEKLGWSEPTVVIRFWIIAFLLALAGLATLRLR
ncbi:MAG TPA: phospho-N-acetylmuramoyl-pentapeptide-transferase [Hyphomonadaceae bacterium]|nr:phospho-N-acetylmuramoyl-pentapeptide-transferase [Hyphomonadaceae bacterium]HPI46918.1 phospho-N-acetylmuramoyl-pentapeptide-transferase [Hyphomonadaceae bacterium]